MIAPSDFHLKSLDIKRQCVMAKVVKKQTSRLAYQNWWNIEMMTSFAVFFGFLFPWEVPSLDAGSFPIYITKKSQPGFFFQLSLNPTFWERKNKHSRLGKFGTWHLAISLIIACKQPMAYLAYPLISVRSSIRAPIKKSRVDDHLTASTATVARGDPWFHVGDFWFACCTSEIWGVKGGVFFGGLQQRWTWYW